VVEQRTHKPLVAGSIPAPGTISSVCVRYTLHKLDAVLAVIAEALAMEIGGEVPSEPRYNIALTQMAPVVALREARPRVREMMWGYVPRHERGSRGARLRPNAKSETVAVLPSFREAARRRRCLVPANGFYEWRSEGGVKYPHLFTLRDGEPFALAGIWDEGGDDSPETFSVLTTRPNAVVMPIHHRMPVVLTAKTMARWLGDRPLSSAELAELTQPLSEQRLSVRPVSRFVNDARHEGPGCVAAPDESRTAELGLDFG
jgi:putative SOS response-associated peptidase YedK